MGVHRGAGLDWNSGLPVSQERIALTDDLRRVIAEIEYCIQLLDGMPTPPNHFEIEPIPSLIVYARRVVELAKVEP